MGYYNAVIIRLCEKLRRTIGEEHEDFKILARAVDISQEDCPHPAKDRRTKHPAAFPEIKLWCGRCSKVLRRD